MKSKLTFGNQYGEYNSRLLQRGVLSRRRRQYKSIISLSRIHHSLVSNSGAASGHAPASSQAKGALDLGEDPDFGSCDGGSGVPGVPGVSRTSGSNWIWVSHCYQSVFLVLTMRSWARFEAAHKPSSSRSGTVRDRYAGSVCGTSTTAGKYEWHGR
jgi:hypothetical protein